MKKFAAIMLAGIVLSLLSHVASARPVQPRTPAELYERAEAVVVVKPITVEPTGKIGTIRLGEKNPVIPVAFFSAKVQIIETIKGRATEEEITIEYSRVDHSRLDPPVLVNGPVRFWVEEGGLFLLYLNRGEGGAYVGALDGDFDDGQASKLLARRNAEQDGADQPAADPE